MEEKVTLHGEANPFLLRLWELVKGGNSFTDIKLEFKDDQSHQGHRIVLAALTPFFETMLTTEMVEKAKNVISLPTVRRELFNHALAFALGQAVEVGAEEELRELLEMAHLLQLWTLTAACGQVLVGRLTPDTCLDTLRLAHKFRLEQVKSQVEEYVAGCLQHVCQEEEWTKLEEEEVTGIILTAQRTSQNADTVVAALLCWLKETSAPTDAVSRMFGLVCLKSLSVEFLCDTLLFHPSVCQSPDVVKAVREMVKSKVCSGSQGGSGASNAVLKSKTTAAAAEAEGDAREREPVPTALVFLASCRENFTVNDQKKSKQYNGMLAWMQQENFWVNLPSPGDGFDAHLVLLNKNTLLVTLSDDDSNPTGTVSKQYSFQKRAWTNECKLCVPRVGHGLVVVKELAYAVGGSCKKTNLKSVEVYDSSACQWKEVGCLLVEICNPGVTALGNLLVIVGGRGDLGQCNLIQTFDTSTRKSAVISAKLPVGMKDVKYCGQQHGGFYFLGTEGHLVKLVEEGGEIRVGEHNKINNCFLFGSGVLCDKGGITVYGGGLGFSTHQRTGRCFAFNGKPKQSSSLTLPVDMPNCQVVPVYENIV